MLAGDARCDSPGYNAKFGTYTLMHADGCHQSGSRKIVDTQLVQVSEVKNSNHMEPEGMKGISTRNSGLVTFSRSQLIFSSSGL